MQGGGEINATKIDLTPLVALYLALGGSAEERQTAYRALFEAHLDDTTLDEVRAALNKAWVLGREHFRSKIDAQLNRRASPLPKGGDRRSEGARNKTANHINRV